MSAQDVFCFDEDSFPALLDRKPSAARRARGVSERKGEAPPSTIVKSFVDTGLGRRRRAKLLSECEDDLACDVPYSMHRKNRWAECNAPALLGDGGEELAIAVVERTAAKKGTRLVNAVHYVDREGSRRSNLAKGKGCDQENLLTEVKEQERPVLLYSLCKTQVTDKPAATTKPVQKKTSRRAGAFSMTSDDAYVPSESEEVVVEEMPVWRRSREPSFCLGDYIVSKQDFVCPPASSSKTNSRDASPIDMTAYVEIAPEEATAPSALLVAKGTYKTIEIPAGKWTRGAHEQMRTLTTSSYYTRWLDANERRLMVDLSTAVCSHCAGRFLLVVVFEKMHNSKNIRMTINCVDDLDLSSLPTADSLDDLLFNTVALAVEKFNDGRPPVEQAAKVNPSMDSTGSLVERDVVLAEHREMSITATSDDFDRILDSDDEDDIVSGQRCNKCGESRADDLFEMEEDWLCRGCLTQTICAILSNRMIVKLNVPILKGDDLIVECKLCMNLVRLKDGFEASVLACPGCKGVSCLSCGCPPHEPLSCKEFAEWSTKFDPTIEALRVDANYKFARAITCECGEEMMLPQEQKEVTCPRCHIAFDAVSLAKKRGGGAVQARAARLVPLPTRTIAKEFAAVAALAHAERIDDRRRAIFERAARKMRSGASAASAFDADAALALRARALHAAEYHAAAAYLAKARAPRAASVMLSAWEALRTAVQEERDEKRASRALEGLKEVLKEAGIV
ncbi:hypothetical protein PRIPAC_74760 [Pristionchus pacificus]|uniref:Uncharacterized protein n=1 Tax=Pristionchus pacificus TaxID=54126 RepID=A0A2A6CT00_PRIPA|nr:hypothetical protein PRIPAC_74760 [Pristionchus pacificus]|eukprot:PDM81163.1 hypothetical protein PRIPAC_36166 [Pristionchus pacificus]